MKFARWWFASTSPCSTALPPDQIAAWPDVESVTRDQQRLQISTSNSEAVVRRLLAADSNLQELEVRRAGLAEAFHGTYTGGRIMNATSIESPKPFEGAFLDGSSLAAVMSTGRLLRAYLVEAPLKLLRMFRVLGFSIPFLVLPAALYLLFGVVLFGDAVRNDPTAGKFLFAAFARFRRDGTGHVRLRRYHRHGTRARSSHAEARAARARLGLICWQNCS